ncbi:MAG: hypothetical protein FVQ84_19105 [Planctomycetes bacterium]|nr:hypothetical protein [Planctomycetota bacterium]
MKIAACLGLALLVLLPHSRAEGASSNESKLRELALKKFPTFTFTETEKKLFQAVANGELVDYSDESGKNNNPKDANQWDEKRVIKAELIAWLCTDKKASEMVTHQGLWIKGARIDTELNLEFSVIPFPLRFEKCAFRGGINLRYAEIQYMELSGTRTNYIDGGGLKVKDSLYLRKGFYSDGKVRLYGATIDKYFVWTDAYSSMLDLRSASVGTLYDQAKSWLPKQYELHGFIYKAIDKKAETAFEKKKPGKKYSIFFDKKEIGLKRRIEWLGGQLNFSSQPYEQLAEVFRKSGKVEDAKEILIAKNKDLRKHNKSTWSKKYWYYVLGPMIGYGYRPLNALWILGAFIAFGMILFGIGYQKGLITPQRGSAYIQRHTGIVIPFDNDRQLSDIYPKFNFLMYSFDAFVPLIDLHQAKYWLPNANRGPELLNISGFGLHTGGLLRFYLWIHIIMGWLLTTLLIVGLSGLIRT